MKKSNISNAVIRRVPRYYRYIDDLNYNGVVCVSSKQLGDKMGLTASQIRQDLSCFGEFGQQGYGYNVKKLRDALIEILGMNVRHTAILVGAGNLARALIHNFAFENYGFKLTAAFDVASNLTDTAINNIPVYHTDKLEGYIAEHTPDIAVLTLPRRFAPQTARRIVNAGVKGIWNFTNIDLHLNDPDIIVENVHFADSLLTLNYMISDKDK